MLDTAPRGVTESEIQMSEKVRIEGTLTDEGVECQAMRPLGGEVYTLTGDLSGYAAGDEVWVEGSIAESSFCMQGITIEVERIGRVGTERGMSDKLDEELARRVKEAEMSAPDREIPVIVTMTESGEIADLERIGLEVVHVIESISAVSGTLTAAEIRAAAEISAVERIEFDGEVRSQGS